MKHERDFVEVTDIRIERTTARAICFRRESITYWVPRSCVDDGFAVFWPGDVGTLLVSRWWLESNELLEVLTRPIYGSARSDDLGNANRVYRRLAAKYHPDRSPDTAEFMKDLNELWQAVLTDIKARLK